MPSVRFPALFRHGLLFWVIFGSLLVSGLCPIRAQETVTPQRIISMAPSVTETLFQLGLGEKVAGVTRYCNYPPAVKNIAKIGGYVDPSYEQILALQPDLIIVLTSHRDVKKELEKLHVPALTVPHKTLEDTHLAIQLIGETCGAQEEAEDLLADIASRTEAIHQAVEGSKKPKVLICIGRYTSGDQLSGMYMAGQDGFYSEMIRIAGGVNACDDEKVVYPQLSPEGVMTLNPDVIIDLVSDLQATGKTTGQLASQWDVLPAVNAVKNNRVHVVTGGYALRPGPRYIAFVEQLASFLHPGIFTEEGCDE
jgi:iron complex transport system substrate-binding protein